MMNIPFELHIALRYLLAKRKQAFISVISLISTLGVTVGVMALVIALALMTGLQQELRDRILGSQPARLRLEQRRASPTTTPRPTSCARSRTSSARRRRSSARALISAGARDGADSDQGRSTRRSSRRSPTSRRAMQSGSLEALAAPADDAAGRHPARQGSGGQARRQGRRLRVGADAAGDAVADGDDSADRAGCASPASSASGCTSSIRTYGFVSLDVAKRLLDKDRRRSASSCASTTSTPRPQIARVDRRHARQRVRRRRTGPT